MIHDFVGRPGKDEIPCRTFYYNEQNITGDQEIADGFCEFFSLIGPNLANDVVIPELGSFMDYLGPPSEQSAFFSPNMYVDMFFASKSRKLK